MKEEVDLTETLSPSLGGEEPLQASVGTPCDDGLPEEEIKQPTEAQVYGRLRRGKE